MGTARSSWGRATVAAPSRTAPPPSGALAQILEGDAARRRLDEVLPKYSSEYRAAMSIERLLRRGSLSGPCCASAGWTDGPDAQCRCLSTGSMRLKFGSGLPQRWNPVACREGRLRGGVCPTAGVGTPWGRRVKVWPKMAP